MNCELTERISLLIDGELNAAEARQIERHLIECPECQEARADFLQMRSQITAYQVGLEPAAPRATLARILSGSRAPVTPEPRPAFGSFVPMFQSRRYSAPIAAFAALLFLAFAVGIFALWRTRPAPEVARTTPPQSSQPSGSSSSPQIETRDGAEANDLVAQRGRAPKGQRETAPNSRKPNSKTKAPRERSTPPSLPQTRNVAPPTYAGINDLSLPVAGDANRPVDTQALTMRHLEQSEVLLRTFRNVRLQERDSVAEVSYERKRARQLIYQNIMLRREADTAGDIQVATLLNSLEPILLDIANLRARPSREEVAAINDRVERKSLVALLQINSSALAKANE